jgi:hypothetical protein
VQCRAAADRAAELVGGKPAECCELGNTLIAGRQLAAYLSPHRRLQVPTLIFFCVLLRTDLICD